MKSIKKLLLFITALIGLVSVDAVAKDFVYEGFVYTVIDENEMTCEMKSWFEGIAPETFISGSVSLPATPYDGDVAYKLVAIGNSAFVNCRDISYIYLPNTLLSIGDFAFSDCDKLKEIKLPNSVNRIGYRCFKNCASLQKVVIECSDTPLFLDGPLIENIPINSLYVGRDWEGELLIGRGLSSFKFLYLNEGVTKIPNEAFMGCSNLKSISIANTVTTIGEFAFSGCSSLTYIEVPQTVYSVGQAAFYNCNQLTNIDFTYNIDEIPSMLFAGCSELQSFDMPSKVNSIGAGAFAGCAKLEQIHIPDNLEILEYNLFQGCSSLSSITIPASVKKIQGSVFKGCSNISKISIPENVDSFGDDAFAQCTELISINIPSRITNIPAYCFEGCKKLPSIDLPDNLVSIGYKAFSGCSSFTEINIPETVESIGGYTFQDISKISTISIPSKVTKIEDGTFQNCSGLTTIDLPSGINSIGSYAFGGCVSLNSIRPLSNISLIGSRAFQGCWSLTSLDISFDKASIFDFAFQGCQNLKVVKISGDIQSMGYQIWKGCEKIREVYYNTLDPVYANSAFDVYNLATLYVPKQTIEIINNRNLEPWKNFKNIEAFTFPGMCTDIKLDYSEYTDNVGSQFKLITIIQPEDAINKTITWTSSNESVAYVDSEGIVALKTIGESIITAVTNDGSELSANCVVTVTPIKVTAIELDTKDWTGFIGDKFSIGATVLPENAPDKTIIWKSENESVATVDENGKVTAVSLGDATITATCGEVKAECNVTVVATPAESIKLSQEAAQLKVGESVRLTAVILPEDATYKPIVWNSDNSDVVTVNDNGIITAVSIGEAEITAACGNISASCIVKVVPLLAQSLSISPEVWNGDKDETFLISAVVLPENTTNKALEYDSSDFNIAKVNDEGLVTVVGIGSCVIKVSTTDGSNLSAECVVTGVLGVESLYGDSKENVDVYDMHGILLKKNCTLENLKQLTSGIYILHSGNTVKTIYLNGGL